MEAEENQDDNIGRWASRESEYGDLKRTVTKSNPIDSRISTKDEFVRRWLVQMERENVTNESSLNTTKRQQKHHEVDQLPDIDFLSSHYFNSLRENHHSRTLRKRQRRNSSSDSSLLVASITTELDSPGRENMSSKYRQEKKPQSHPRIGHETVASEKEASRKSINREETFEKHPRRKTRHDRYDPKDWKSKPELHRQEKRQRTRGGKKSDKKRAGRKSGEDLMHSFSSKYVAQDRLTFRPSHGQGLFNNGRISSPQRRTGLPDLASSEMRFLQRPARALATKAHEKVVSKSHEKDGREADRERLEISTFFTQRKAPFEEVAVNARRQTSPTLMTEEHETSRKDSLNDCHAGKDMGLRFTTTSPERRNYVSSQLSQLSDTACTPGGRYYSSTSRRQAFGPVRAYPWSEATYANWSESQRPPIVRTALDRLRNIGELEASPIPDSIIRSLEKTRIFRDTGIEWGLALNQARVSLNEMAGIEKRQSNSPNRDCSLTVNEGTVSQHPLTQPHQQVALSLNKGHSPKICMSPCRRQKLDIFPPKQVEHPCCKCHPQGGISPVRSQQAVAEQLASNSGLLPCRAKSCPLPEALYPQPPQKPTSPPITRGQIAQQARIRYPSETVKVAKSAKDGLLQDGNEDRAIQNNSPDNPQSATAPKEPLSRYIITDTSITRDPGYQTQSFDISARSVSTLPVLESNTIRAVDAASRPACLWPTVECHKMSVSQLPQRYFLETKQVPSNTIDMDEAYDDQFEEGRNAMVHCNEHVEWDIWEQEYVAAALLADRCGYVRFDESVTGPYNHYGIHSADPELWEVQALLPLPESTDADNPECIPFQGAFPPYRGGIGQNKGYEHVSDDAGDILRDFWRPQRTY